MAVVVRFDSQKSGAEARVRVKVRVKDEKCKPGNGIVFVFFPVRSVAAKQPKVLRIDSATVSVADQSVQEEMGML
jgi:hypothetical protein